MRRLIALGCAVLATVLLAGPAAAASPALHVAPGSVPAGGSVVVSGTCEANTTGFAISPAFRHDSTHDFAGVGAAPFHTDAGGAFSVTAQVPASIAADNYQVTARCGGGNLGISATLTVTGATAGPPTAVPAGTGGQAATNPERSGPILLAVTGLGLLALGGLGLGWLRRSRPRAGH